MFLPNILNRRNIERATMHHKVFRRLAIEASTYPPDCPG
jgi:hypothetical protein